MSHLTRVKENILSIEKESDWRGAPIKSFPKNEYTFESQMFLRRIKTQATQYCLVNEYLYIREIVIGNHPLIIICIKIEESIEITRSIYEGRNESHQD